MTQHIEPLSLSSNPACDISKPASSSYHILSSVDLKHASNQKEKYIKNDQNVEETINFTFT